MQIATNIPDETRVRSLRSPIMIKKYPCTHFIKVKSGKTFYFTGIRSIDDIVSREFSCVAKSRSEDAYVLAPMLNSNRETTLIIIQLNPKQELLSLQQNCLFDFFHWNDTLNGTIIAGLAYDFPEIFTNDVSTLRLFISEEKEESTLLETGYYNIHYSKVDYHPLPKYPEYSIFSLKRYGLFTMHATNSYWTVDSSRFYMHPATRFVINSLNVIFINKEMEPEDISKFLMNGNIPSDVVIIWASEDPTALDSFEEMVKGYVYATPKFHHYIFIGFPYQRTVEMRTFVTTQNIKKYNNILG